MEAPGPKLGLKRVLEEFGRTDKFNIMGPFFLGLHFSVNGNI